MDPNDEYYANLTFGPTRMDVPSNFHVYEYLNASARYYFLPGFLKLALMNPEESGDLAISVLTDLSEPDMQASEDRFVMWALLLDMPDQERQCIAKVLPALEDIGYRNVEMLYVGGEALRRAAIWDRAGKP